MKSYENMQNTKSRIILAKAEVFTDARNITMQLKTGNSLLFVVRALDENEKQRILDYISGAVSILNLTIKKVSSEAFLVASPEKIEGFNDPDDNEDLMFPKNSYQMQANY